MIQNFRPRLLAIRENWFAAFGSLFLALFAGCASVGQIASPDAIRQLEEAGGGYGVVVAIVPADDEDARRVCREGKVVPSFLQYCPELGQFQIVTANVAATSRRSFLKALIMVQNSIDVQKGDIVEFRFGEIPRFVRVASRGERADCKWVGSPPKMMGFPFQEGGIACDGWSYKRLMHIDWKPKTWL